MEAGCESSALARGIPHSSTQDNSATAIFI
jgi:hypothetical protein